MALGEVLVGAVPVGAWLGGVASGDLFTLAGIYQLDLSTIDHAGRLHMAGAMGWHGTAAAAATAPAAAAAAAAAAPALLLADLQVCG